jgi:hypothetical protein
VFLALVRPVAFWAIDGYYLYLERCYRDRFDEVKKTTDAVSTSFEMSPLTTNRTLVKDGLMRPAVWAVHALILALAFSAWQMVK